MTLTPPCDTPGCKRPSVHVMPYEKILGRVRKAHHKCVPCYKIITDKRYSRKERS